MGVVYCAENIVNGYKYIGITVQTLEIRKNAHYNAALNPKNIGYNRPFMIALRDNSNIFKWYVLKETDSEIELKKLERFYINKYRTYVGFQDCKGYNATFGGDGVSVLREKVYRIDSNNYTIKEEFNNLSEVEKKYNTKVHIMSCCQNKRETSYGEVWYYKSGFESLTKEMLIKDVDYRVNKVYLINKSNKILKKYLDLEELLREKGLEFIKIFLNSKELGFCFAKDYYNNVFDKGLYSSDNIVVQFDIDCRVVNIFLSMHDAENKTGIHRPSIKAVCNGNKKTAGGFQWRYIEDVSEVTCVKSGRDNVIHTVSQYDKNGNYIRTFESLTEASNITGIDVSAISKVCRGLKQTTGGFRWTYGDSKKKLESLEIYENNQKKAVCFINEKGERIIFESINDASRRTGYSSSYVSKQCKNKKSNWFFI